MLIWGAHRPGRFLGLAQLAIDVAAWASAAWLAVYLRFDFQPSVLDREQLLKFLPIVVAVQAGVGFAVGLYRRRWRYGSFDEVAKLGLTAAVTTAVLLIIDGRYLHPRLVPVSTVLLGGAIGLLLMAGVRYLVRLLFERSRRPSDAGAERALLFGAGQAGQQLVRTIMQSSASPYLPVGILDDDPATRHLHIHGVSVVGSRASLAEQVRKLDAGVLLIAVPSAGPDLIAELADAATGLGLPVKVLPPVYDLLGTHPGLADIRDVSEADLLGRGQITTDLESIAGYLTGKRVLVTGAGGSIGAELCRQLSRYGPSELTMLDRDESGLHAVQLSIEGRALLDTPNVVLADVREAEGICRVFEDHRPQVVFHAAALKHLPILEQYPHEAVKTNVWGTQAVLDAAIGCDVERFVNVSTDKAANPTSVLGRSKRIAERITASAAQRATGTFLSVRFGNVLGSRGSVLGTFHAQIEAGGPVTVTHPDVTRYFMTVSEAIQLVIQAGAIGRPGEVLVLDMGQQVRILDIARRLVGWSRQPVEIVFTGLRPGEKLHEELFGVGEIDARPIHPLIAHSLVPPLDVAKLDEKVDALDADAIVAWLREQATAD
jgi:FlaA1/EpsC-like NDP-sugar epimerase